MRFLRKMEKKTRKYHIRIETNGDEYMGCEKKYEVCFREELKVRERGEERGK